MSNLGFGARIRGMKRLKQSYILSCGLLALILNLFIELMSRRSLTGLLTFIVTRPHIFLYGAGIIFLTMMPALLFRRRVFVLFLVSLVWAAAGITDFVLLTFRTTPFTAVDLKLVKYALNMLDKYISWYQIILALAAVSLAVAGGAWIFIKAPRYEGRIQYVKIVLMICVFSLAAYGATSLGMETGIFAKNFGNLADAYHEYGFVYCFGSSLLNTGITKPEDYAPEVIVRIESEDIEKEDIGSDSSQTVQENVEGTAVSTEESQEISGTVRKDTDFPNVIMIQLESFFDPQTVEGLVYSKDPIPNFHQLQEKYSSGYMLVPSVGAGTANTEFEVLTGMNLDFFGPGEYPYKTVLKETTCESISYIMKKLDFTAHAIHNNDGTFYDRHIVFSQLGFDTFTPIEYMNRYETNPVGWAKDKVLQTYITEALNATEGQDFIYTITVQDHGAYPQTEVIQDPEIIVEGCDTEAEHFQMEYFVNQLYETDQFIGELIHELSTWPEDVVVVMYGDHLPPMGFEEDEIDTGSLFQTPYVVWSNFDMERKELNLEAYQMAAYVLERLNIHLGTMPRLHQKYMNMDAAERDEEAYLENMRLLEYDLLYGDKTADEKKLESTDLQMGLDEIKILDVGIEYGNLYVRGNYFTPSSRVFIDDSEQETVYVSPYLLVVHNTELIPGESFCLDVRQVGADKIELGRTLTWEE